MASSTSLHNHRIVQYKFQAFRQMLEAELAKRLCDVARDMVAWIEMHTMSDSGDIPFYTGNLRDSTGVGVYINGKCTAFVPVKVAKEPQRSGFGRNLKDIWGHKWLIDAINFGATGRFSHDCWIVLFSAVPYAAPINAGVNPFSAHGQNYFARLKNDFVSEIFSQLKPIGTLTKI